MNNTFGVSSQHLEAFQKNRKWFFVWGIALIVLGALAVSFATFTTLLSVIVLAGLIFASGIVIIIDAFTFWWEKWSGFFLHLIMGLLYAIVGVMLLRSPVLASISLTLLLGVLYLMLGIFRIIYSLWFRLPRWGWSFFSGLLGLLLGVLILAEWPASSLFIIGLFVGIDLIVVGWVYVMAASQIPPDRTP